MLLQAVAIIGVVIEAVVFWRIYACLFGGLIVGAATWLVVSGIGAEPVLAVGAVAGLVIGVCWHSASSREHRSPATGGAKLSRDKE